MPQQQDQWVLTLEYDGDVSCASACALIAIAGLFRTGTIGVHHMYIKDGDIDYDDLDALLQQSTEEVADFLTEMRAPPTLMQDIVSTPSTEIKWIQIKDVGEHDPIFQEYLISRCGGLTDAQQENKRNLMLLRDIGFYIDRKSGLVVEYKISPTELRYLEELEQEELKSFDCKYSLKRSATRKAQGFN